MTDLVLSCVPIPNEVSGHVLTFSSLNVVLYHYSSLQALVLMVGRAQVKRSGSQKKKQVTIIDSEATEGRNRRGARVYYNLEVPKELPSKELPSTSQRHTDGSKSPSKRMRSLSPEIGNDQGYGSVPPYKRLRRKTKV
jgi:hypothetical protein